MADSSGMADIRNIDIQKLVVAYNQEARIFRNFVTIRQTSAREIRWQQLTAGILTATSTTTGTSAPIDNVAYGALPNVIEPTFTRNTSYVQKYFAGTPIISYEDIADNQVDLFSNVLRQVVVAIEFKVDTKIWNIMTESQSAVNINTNASTAAWDAASGQDPIKDILKALQDIRTNTSQKVVNPVLFLSPKDHTSLLTWLISTKGSSVPAFATARLEDGVVLNLLGCQVVVSTNVTADFACVAVPDEAVVWYEFTPVTSGIVEHVGVGREIRVWAEGIAVNEKPKFVSLITNTQT